MKPTAILAVLWRGARARLTRRLLSLRVLAHHPGLRSDPTAIWDYAWAEVAAIEIGRRVSVAAHAEIIVYRHVRHSRIEGKLVLHDGAVISTGCNLRAAGGRIEIGRASAIGQHTVVVAANHTTGTARPHVMTAWDETRTGVILGDNVWVGANCTLLPGTRIGDSAVIAAGSVVRGEVPPGEIWGGVPARRLRAAEAGLAQAAADAARAMAATGTPPPG